MIVGASHVVVENANIAAEKVKEGANKTIEAISGAAHDAKESAI